MFVFRNQVLYARRIAKMSLARLSPADCALARLQEQHFFQVSMMSKAIFSDTTTAGLIIPEPLWRR
jgi:hypothetical protein